MTTVFIGGSRRIVRLSNSVLQRAKNVIEKNYNVVIGDANGADKAVQMYFAAENYRNVTVYCSGAECRNNLGNWETHHVETGNGKRDFEFYAVKDAAMSNVADYGFMLWDGLSAGTVNNAVNLVEKGKQVLLYLSPRDEFITLRTIDEIRKLVEKCPPDVGDKLVQRLKLDQRLSPAQAQMNLAP
jgi:hypothetical protein